MEIDLNAELDLVEGPQKLVKLAALAILTAVELLLLCAQLDLLETISGQLKSIEEYCKGIELIYFNLQSQ